MALDFDGSTGYLSFTKAGIIPTLSAVTITAWVNPDAISSDDFKGIARLDITLDVLETFSFALFDKNISPIGNDRCMGFTVGADGSADYGIWFSANNSVSIGSYQFLSVSYEYGNIANDPVFYNNGTISATTEGQTPGDILTQTSNDYLNVGRTGTGGQIINGKIQDLRIYNVIKTQTQIQNIMNSYMLKNDIDGLVSWIPMIGAKGISKFDGVTLTASNTVLDEITLVNGVPSGTIIGAGNTLQRVY